MGQAGINVVRDTMGSSLGILQRRQDSALEFYPSSEVYKRVTRVKSPSVTPGYVLLKKSKSLIAPLPYSTKTNVSYSNVGTSELWFNEGRGAWRYLLQVGVCGWTYGYPVYSESISQIKERADKMAVIKLLNKAKDSKFNGMVAYAESKQTHRLIGDFAVKMAKVLTNLRRGDLVSAGKVVGLTIGKRAATRYRKRHKGLKSKDDIDQMLASGVLSVQYGIRPLISDVIGAAELYAQKRVFEVINRAKASQKVVFDEDHEFVAGTTKHIGNRKGYVIVTYGCYFTTGSEILHTMKQLGITNPLLVAWELMPWSFVIDWVFPFGNYLSSLDATLGLSFKTGYRSTRFVCDDSCEQIIRQVPYSRNDWVIENSRYKNTYDEFDRIVLSGFPSPSLPSFKNPASWEHALNGIALLAGFKKNAYTYTSSNSLRVS